MKKSNYNYIIKKDGNSYCFNALTRHFFNIPEKGEEILKAALESPDECKDKLPGFYDRLLQGGFIVENEINELDIIRKKHQEACNSKKYSLTILPTIDCNFNCWYCYEKHVPYVMSDETINRIKKYTEKLLQCEEIEHFSIEWFGGEPFLAFENVIKPITLHAKKICEKKNIPFSTGATSNGFLITPNVADELASLNLQHIQVTLDGEKSLHDKTRVAPEGSSFETILRNMNYLCQINEAVQIILRINYDEKNLQPELILNQVKELIDEKYHSQFSFLLRKVWQVEKVDNGKVKVERFIELIKDTQFKYCYESDLILDFTPCYATRKNMKLITPYGSIGKCTTKNDFEKCALGLLTEEGNIKWKNDLPFDEIYATPQFENKNCLNCKQLPLCMGACPQNIDIEGNIIQSGQCKGKVNDLAMADAIANYCLTIDHAVVK